MPCMLSPSDRQRRTGTTQAVARVCTPTLSTQAKSLCTRVAQASAILAYDKYPCTGLVTREFLQFSASTQCYGLNASDLALRPSTSLLLSKLQKPAYLAMFVLAVLQDLAILIIVLLPNAQRT